MTYYGKIVIGGKIEGFRRNEQWPRLAIGFFACRVMRAPSGGKTKSISTFVSSAPRHHSSLLIYIDRLGALNLTLAIPRLQTVRYAPVFAAGYDLSLLRSVIAPGAIACTSGAGFCHR